MTAIGGEICNLRVSDDSQKPKELGFSPDTKASLQLILSETLWKKWVAVSANNRICARTEAAGETFELYFKH